MDYAYITKSNFKKFSYNWLQPKDSISIDVIFSLIYEKSLSEIINNQEATRLYVQKEMLEGRYNSLVRIEKKFHPNYVFSVSTPKFHKQNCCESLNSDFKNYLVPSEIKALGNDKVKEFQEFCESTKKDFEGKSDDIFWANAGIKFGVSINPVKISYDNSGTKEIDKLTIAELKEYINGKLEDSLEMLNNKDEHETLMRFRYAPNIIDAISKNQDLSDVLKERVNEFAKLKRNIIDSLFVLYQKQVGTEGYILPVDLCTRCGLEPCKVCWK